MGYNHSIKQIARAAARPAMRGFEIDGMAEYMTLIAHKKNAADRWMDALRDLKIDHVMDIQVNKNWGVMDTTYHIVIALPSRDELIAERNANMYHRPKFDMLAEIGKVCHRRVIEGDTTFRSAFIAIKMRIMASN